MSGCCIMFMGCVAVDASWALRTSALHAITATSVAAQDLAGVQLAGLVYGCNCCITAGDKCPRGNPEAGGDKTAAGPASCTYNR